MKKYSIVLRAGKTARAHIEKNGLKPDDITFIAGASGGPKFLILNGLDRAIFSTFFKNRRKELHLLGSSIGSFRFAAAAQKNPIQAFDILINAYTHQRYTGRPSPSEITDESIRIMDEYCPEERYRNILTHPYMRLNFVTAKAKGLANFDNPIALGLHFTAAKSFNMISRKKLGLLFKRVIFSDPRSSLPSGPFSDMDTRIVELKQVNFKKALLASGSIPFVMSGIKDIPEAPGGMYWDGGIIDYHFDIPFQPVNRGLVLYPHFFDRIIPGWLDKTNNRKASAENYDNVIFVAPSDSFIHSLPDKKVPDRDDFIRYSGDDEKRFELWTNVSKESNRLGDDFLEVIQTDNIINYIRPIEEILAS